MKLGPVQVIIIQGIGVANLLLSVSTHR